MSYLVIGHELGSATDIDRLLVYSGLSTPIFTLIGNDDFSSCHTGCRPKMLPKNDNFELSSISRRDRVGFSNCLNLHMHYCATVSASNFQVLICSGRRDSTFKNLYPLFGSPSSCVRLSRTFIRFLARPARVNDMSSKHYSRHTWYQYAY